MATGTVWYWNGQSGWIKQSGVENLPTALAMDLMLLQSEVVSGTVQLNGTVSFTPDLGDLYWLARSVTAS